MTAPYAVVSDQHFHSWGSFAETTPEGFNSRLVAQIAELKRCAAVLKAAGGNIIVNAGDTFHTRGTLKPSVLNPVRDAHRELIEQGFEFLILAGNHDAELRDVTRGSSAITALEEVGCTVFNDTGYALPDILFVPWIDSVADLKTELLRISAEYVTRRSKIDLVIHAPVNGVIMGIPDHGLEPQWLADLGFKRVLSGHYHNHKVFCNGKVISVGATGHQTWSDVGSVAGFMLVYPDRIEHFPSELPQFIDVASDMPVSEIAKLAPGNYLRVKVTTSKLADIQKMRDWLTGLGAKGVVILSVKQPTEERATGAATVHAGASIEQSISSFIRSKSFDPDLLKEIEMGALKILAEAELS